MRVRYDVVQVYVFRHAYGGGVDFLQLRRAPGEYLAGTWQSIYGGILEGEKAYETALRELREETGLVPLEFFQLDTVNTFYMASDDAIWNCPGFSVLVGAEPDIVLNEEHDAFRWLGREQFMQHLMWPGERMACAELCREILDNGPARKYLQLPIPPG